MGDTYVWTGADTLTALGSSPENIDDPLNWFDQTTDSVAVHAPESADTAVFTADARNLYAGGTADGGGSVLVTSGEFSPATLEVANGAQISFASGPSPIAFLIGTLEVGPGGSLALVGSSMDANVADIAAGGTLDLSQADWIGAPNDGPPGSALQDADRAAGQLGYPGPLNAVFDTLTVEQGGRVMLGNGCVGVGALTDANASGTGNSFSPLSGFLGSGSVVAPLEHGPYGGVAGGSINFGTVVEGQTAVATLTLYGSPGDLGSGVPVGAIQTSVNGANISDPDLSGPGVTAQNFGTSDYQPGGPVDVATFSITLDAQHTGSLQGQAINLAFDLNGGQYGENLLVPITGDVVKADSPCFVAGTRIAAASGEVRVESLRPGDTVRTADGRLAPVVWVGHRTLRDAAPIRISPSAVAQGVPSRALLLSPDHAVLVEGVLVPAHLLANGATVTVCPAGPATYVHVELDRHDILLAEGLATESFLDTGNRGQFDREAGVRPLFAACSKERPQASVAAYGARGCAPLVLDGPALQRAHRRLLRRARALGWTLGKAAAVMVLADGRRLPASQDAAGLTCLLPAGTCAVRLISRQFVPRHLDASRHDGRRLGIAAAIRLDGEAPIDSAFAAGWYPPDAGCDWRWTNGDAVLAVNPTSQPVTLEVRLLEAGGRYWQAPVTRRERRAA